MTAILHPAEISIPNGRTTIWGQAERCEQLCSTQPSIPGGTRSHWGWKKRHGKGLHPSRNLLQPEQPQGSGDLGCFLLWEATAMGNEALVCRHTALPCNLLLPLSPKQGSLHKMFTLRVSELPTLIRLLQAAIKCFCHLGGWCDSIKASKSQHNSPLGPHQRPAQPDTELRNEIFPSQQFCGVSGKKTFIKTI